jgi:non-ribosomal peptide synthetase component F
MPDNIALVFEGEQLTYGELNEKANQLAHAIRQSYFDSTGYALKADTLIPLYLDRSLEMIISILAVLKAGGAYVPISPEYPAERTQYILTDTSAKMVVTQSQHLEVLAVVSDGVEYQVSLLAADLPSTYASMPTQAPSSASAATDLAYVIYTSGTTGKPKGVMVAHQGPINLILWYVAEFMFSQDDQHLIFSSFCFDLTQKNIFSGLIKGGCITLPAMQEYDPKIINQCIKDTKTSVINCAPSAFYPLLQQALEETTFDSLRLLVLGGEPNGT